MKAKRLTGRCANGAERDGGKLSHLIEDCRNIALCGAKPGKRSNGWSIYDETEVTCKKCLDRLMKVMAVSKC